MTKDHVAVFVLDITERKQAEDSIKNLNEELELRVKQRTAQLEAVNNELETFTYSVSHDLKAPLRGIDGYSKLLLDIYGSKLTEEANYFLTTIRSSTIQMNQLIEDLLEYSRLERSQMRSEKIQIKNLIVSIVSLYQVEINNGKYLLKIDVPDIELVADSNGLTIALRNLLENSLKFTRGKSSPAIEISLNEKPTSWTITISDNGIGFDMKYQQRIFEIFQRLHRVEDFPGTGIGLAMVSKAMQRMQGKVWAESTLNVGSSFYLEIPKLI
jgi:light-regulated signal transduction histidine kinase (bacteriophytochrome)